MKRRGFIAGLTAFVAGTKAAFSEPIAPVRETDWSTREITAPVDDHAYDAIAHVQQGTAKPWKDTPAAMARRFANDYELRVRITESNVALFTLEGPMLSRSWSVGLSYTAVPIAGPARVYDAKLPLLKRQLEYQYAKALRSIESECGWRRVPPTRGGIFHGVASIDEADYLPVPIAPRYTGWNWERV